MKDKLDWPDLWNHLGMKKDSGGRWYPGDTTPSWICEYVQQYRTPSRSWPNSYATPLLTKKFAKKVVDTDHDLAVTLGLAEDDIEYRKAEALGLMDADRGCN